MKATRRMLIVSIGAVAALSQIAALAQKVNASQGDDEDVDFKKGEINFSPFGTYVDKAGGKWGAGAALTYFVTDKIGLGGATYWTDTGGTFFDNFEAEGYFRLPLFKRIAPYAVGTIGYQFDRDYWFETVGAGVDFRAFKHIQAFGDLQYRIANTSNSGNGAFLRIGARFDF